MNAIFRHDYPLAVKPGSTPRPVVQKKTWRDSLPIDMLLSAVSVLVVAQSILEIPEGLMNNPVFCYDNIFNMYLNTVKDEVVPVRTSPLRGMSSQPHAPTALSSETLVCPLNT